MKLIDEQEFNTKYQLLNAKVEQQLEGPFLHKTELRKLSECLQLFSNPDVLNDTNKNRLDGSITSMLNQLENNLGNHATITKPQAADEYIQAYNEFAKDNNGEYKEGYAPPRITDEGHISLSLPNDDAKGEFNYFSARKGIPFLSMKETPDGMVIIGHSNGAGEYVTLTPPAPEEKFDTLLWLEGFNENCINDENAVIDNEEVISCTP